METPASRRHFRNHAASATVSPAPRASGTARREPPPYQPQVAQLNGTAQRAIQNLSRGVNLKHLTTYIAHASGALSSNAGEINDRLTDAKARYENQKKRQREAERRRRNAENNGDENDDDVDWDAIGRNEETEKKIEEMEKRVKELTAKMEQGMRRVVDTEVDLDTMKGILEKLGRTEGEGAGSSLAKRRRGSGDEGRRRRRLRGDAEDEDEEPDDGDDSEDSEEQAEAPEIIPASRIWDEQLAEQRQNREALPMEQRYGTNHLYIDFYRTVHEAKHGNDVPPIPHASTWFDHLTTQSSNGPTTSQPTGSRRKRKSQADRDADDIAIQSERMSIKCPLTLQNFVDPVTSSNCSHSFEREAIENMLSRSRATIPVSGRNVRCIECPVCSAKITKDNLRTDQVLASRVKRLNRIAEMEEEDGGEDDDGDEDEDGNVIMGRAGGDGRRDREAARVKVEEAMSQTRERSVVSDTQFDAVGEEEKDEDEDEESDDESGSALSTDSEESMRSPDSS